MQIKTKADLDFAIPDIVLKIETGIISIPIFPHFKRPSYNKQLHLKPLQPSTSYLSSPSKHEDTLSSSTKITNIYPDSQSSLNYIVNHHLQTMKKHLNSPTRSEVEGQIIRNLISANSKLTYMLCVEWATNYTSYLQHKINNQPGPINNSRLFQEGSSTFKENLKQDVDFVLMNRNTWLFIQALYGGGPEITLQDFMKETQQLTSTQQLNFDNTSLKHTLSRVSSLQVDTQSYMSVQVPFEKSQFQLPPVGLYNEHNYCFMHAALQSLLSVEQMNCWILNEGAQILKKNGDKMPFVNCYMELVLANSNKKPGAFIKVQSLKQQIKHHFDPRQQHDSQEFLRFLIEKLGTDIQGQDKYEQPITDIVFQGQMMSLVECQGCLYKSSKLEAFLDISVSMSNTLDDSLKEFFGQEVLNDNYQCENCMQITKAIKRYVIGTPPHYLMIHIKRFQVLPSKLKLLGHVKFPVTLDVDEFCQIKAKYKLKSVIVHNGTPEKGHYVNFSLRNNQWYYFDDHKVYLVTEQDVLQQQAYVLFYEKIEEYILDIQQQQQ